MLKEFKLGTAKLIHNIFTCDETWVYSYEPEAKQQSTVWVFPDEPNSTKIVRSRSTSNEMIACSFCLIGYISAIPLKDQKTVNFK